MKCPECQFDNPEGMQFCGKCGVKLELICPKCNFSNPSVLWLGFDPESCPFSFQDRSSSVGYCNERLGQGHIIAADSRIKLGSIARFRTLTAFSNFTKLLIECDEFGVQMLREHKMVIKK